MTGTPRAIRLLADSRLENVELLGRAVRALCASAGMDPRVCAHVELALVEAANNVVRHAYRLEAGHPVEVTFMCTERHISLDVSDEGSAMPNRPVPVMDFDPSDLAGLPEGGMGLYLIHSVMDEVEYHSHAGRNTLHMRRRLAA